MRRCANMRRPIAIYNFAPDPSEFPSIWGIFFFHQCTVPSSIRHESISDQYCSQKKKSWCTNKGGSSTCMQCCLYLLYPVVPCSPSPPPHPPPPPVALSGNATVKKSARFTNRRRDFQSPYNFGAAILVAAAILALRILLYHSAVA